MTRRDRSWVRIAIGLAVLLLAATIASATAERTHRVAPGESASSVAARYYGDYDLADLLLRFNGKAGTVIHVGESLAIPVCEEHVVRAGDTWSALSQRYLGRAEVWPAVAMLNGLPPERPLSVGQRLVFPVVLDHALRSGESLAVLAHRFYGDPQQARIIQRFNAIDDPRRLSIGARVMIPLIAFRARGSAEPASTSPAPTPPAPSPPPSPRFAEELRSASLAIAEGEFDAAENQVQAMRYDVTRDGSPAEQAEMWRLLAIASVAMGDSEQVCQAYHALNALPSVHRELDPDLVSPKVREALASCGRQ
jgi:LysM repeat protein